MVRWALEMEAVTIGAPCHKSSSIITSLAAVAEVLLLKENNRGYRPLIRSLVLARDDKTLQTNQQEHGEQLFSQIESEIATPVYQSMERPTIWPIFRCNPRQHCNCQLISICNKNTESSYFRSPCSRLFDKTMDGFHNPTIWEEEVTTRLHTINPQNN